MDDLVTLYGSAEGRTTEAARRHWQRALSRWERDGTLSVRRVAGRVGRPRLQVLASDLERWAGLADAA